MTRPVYCASPAEKLISSPFSLPVTGVATLLLLSVPVITKVCFERQLAL